MYYTSVLDVRVKHLWPSLIFLVFLCYIFNISRAAEFEEFPRNGTVQSEIHQDEPVTVQIESNDWKHLKLLIAIKVLNGTIATSSLNSSNEPNGKYHLDEEPFVTVHFSNAYSNQSTEIVLKPSGRLNVALLDGHRKAIVRDLTVNYTWKRENSTWLGAAIVPLDYLPSGVTTITVFVPCAGNKGTDTQGSSFDSTEYDYCLIKSTPFKRSGLILKENDRTSSTWRDSIHGNGEYWITTTWDSKKIDHPDHPVIIHMEKHDDVSFKILVSAPLYSDPDHPPGLPGEPFFGLWDYEVAKVFLVNEKNEYVAIELSPHGQYLVMFFNGYRKLIRHNLFINYTAEKMKDSWRGTAIIPNDYLPPNVTRMNSFAIHGSGKARTFESLYPTITPSQAVKDFHKLEDFKPFNRSLILNRDVTKHSSIWQESLHGKRTFKITHSWTGELLNAAETVDLSVRVQHNSLILTVDAPFFNDDAPSRARGPFPFLHDYEVVHFFLLNSDGEYFEIQIGPYGHYLVAFKPYWNGIAFQKRYPISYHAVRSGPRWNGTAAIPLSYLPPRVNKCNAFSTHGIGKDRKYNSLYLVPTVMAEPDYELTQYFREIDFSLLHPGNEEHQYSQIWQTVIQRFNTPPNSATHTAPTLLMIISIGLTIKIFYRVLNM